MTNYNTILTSMTPEKMAELGVKLIHVNNRELYYVTSSGQLFNIADYDRALIHEYNWLMYDSTLEKTSEDTEGPNPDADKNSARDGEFE